MILKELIAKIGFDVDEKKLDGVEQRLEGIHKLLEAFAAVEIIRGIAEMTEKFGEMAEKIHLAATSAGITTEAFQKMAFAAEQNGVSADEMSSAMARITRHLYDARVGSAEAQKIFQQAGFTSDQIKNFKNGSEVLHALADRFKGMKDPVKEIGILMPLAGRASYNMVSYLQQGGEGMRKLEQQAEELGAVLSEDQVQALVEAKHAVDALSSVMKALAASIAANFAPSVKTAVEQFLDFYKVNKDIVQLEVKKWVYDITYAMGAVWAVVKFVTQAFFDFAKSHEVLVRRAGELILAIGGIVSAIFLFKTGLGLMMTVIRPAIDLLQVFGGGLKLIRFLFSGLLEVIAYVTKAEWLLNAAIAVTEAPIWAVAAAIGALIIAGQALWKVLSGGSLKDSWIGQLMSWVGSLSGVKEALSWISKAFSAPAAGVLPQPGETNGFAAGAANALQNITSLGGLAAAPQASVSTQNIANTTGGTTEINAPVTINVPAGTDPKHVGEKVKEGIQQHLDRLHRETQRSLRTAQVY